MAPAQRKDFFKSQDLLYNLFRFTEQLDISFKARQLILLFCDWRFSEMNYQLPQQEIKVILFAAFFMVVKYEGEIWRPQEFNYLL